MCVGKKTALLQILVVCRLVRFANVLFCALAVHYFVFHFLSLSSKLSAVSVFLHLPLTVDGLNCWGVNRQRRYPPLKTRLKVIKILHLHHQPQ